MPELDRRLQARYEKLVLGHLATLQDVAAGIRSLPDASDSFAATQAAWRFFANESTTLPALAAPLLQAAAAGLRDGPAAVALVACDWCQLHYAEHTRKRDRAALTNRHDKGYELHTALLLSDHDGEPVAPVHLSLRTAEGLFLSSKPRVRRQLHGSKLDRLLPLYRFVERQGWPQPRVYVIDREADSVDHYRLWDSRGLWFVVRGDDNRRVGHEGQQRLLPEVHQRLRQRGAFRRSRAVLYHGQQAVQYVAETTVCLHRPGKHRQGRVSRPGRALALRLVVTEVRGAQGQVLAYWLLMTNVPGRFDAATVALWYYWRWRIESYFKLLKSAGQEAEHWQQRSGLAIAKRLLVASMACVLAWKLARSAHPAAGPLRDFLIRLSGRQMKYGADQTDPALLAGLWALLQAVSIVERFDVAHLQSLLRQVLFETEPHLGPP